MNSRDICTIHLAMMLPQSQIYMVLEAGYRMKREHEDLGNCLASLAVEHISMGIAFFPSNFNTKIYQDVSNTAVS